MNNQRCHPTTLEKRAIFQLLMQALFKKGLSQAQFYECYKQTLSSNLKMLQTIQAHTTIFEEFIARLNGNQWAIETLATIKNILLLYTEAGFSLIDFVPRLNASLNNAYTNMKPSAGETEFWFNDRIKERIKCHCFALYMISLRLWQTQNLESEVAQKLFELSTSHLRRLKASHNEWLPLLIDLFHEHPSHLTFFQQAETHGVRPFLLTQFNKGNPLPFPQNLAFLSTLTLFTLRRPTIRLCDLLDAWLPEFNTYSYINNHFRNLLPASEEELMPAPPSLLEIIKPHLDRDFINCRRPQLGLRPLVSLLMSTEIPFPEQIQGFLPYLPRFIERYHRGLNLYPLLKFILFQQIGSPALFEALIEHAAFCSRANVTRALMLSDPSSFLHTLQHLREQARPSGPALTKTSGDTKASPSALEQLSLFRDKRVPPIKAIRAPVRKPPMPQTRNERQTDFSTSSI